MANLDILIRNKDLSRIEFPINSGASILRFNVLRTVTHEMKAAVTKNPIEDGSKIADHVNVENKRATFQIQISDTPLLGIVGLPQEVLSSVIVDKIRKLPTELIILGGIAVKNISGNIVEDTNKKSKIAFDILENLLNNKTLIKAFLGFKRYENAIITNVSVPQNATNSGSLIANITIEEIRIVRTERALIPKEVVEEEVEHTATSEIDTGAQEKKDVSTDDQTRSSVLFSLFGGD